MHNNYTAKLGEKFVMVDAGDGRIPVGDIVVLSEQDGTNNPFFKYKNCTFAINWRKLQPLEFSTLDFFKQLNLISC